mgnify:CR=1 FL=1
MKLMDRTVRVDIDRDRCIGCGACVAVSAFKNDPGIREQLDIPPGESVRAVIALGYPDRKEVYQRLPGRKALISRVWEPRAKGTQDERPSEA